MTVGDLLVGAVLQEPREEQIAGLEQGEVFLALDLAAWQQARGFQVEQSGRDDEEFGRLAEIPAAAEGPDVRDEIIGDLRQRDLGNVELVLADQLQQQVERAFEVRQAYGEFAGPRPAARRIVEFAVHYAGTRRAVPGEDFPRQVAIRLGGR